MIRRQFLGIQTPETIYPDISEAPTCKKEILAIISRESESLKEIRSICQKGFDEGIQIALGVIDNDFGNHDPLKKKQENVSTAIAGVLGISAAAATVAVGSKIISRRSFLYSTAAFTGLSGGTIGYKLGDSMYETRAEKIQAAKEKAQSKIESILTMIKNFMDRDLQYACIPIEHWRNRRIPGNTSPETSPLHEAAKNIAYYYLTEAFNPQN